MSLYILPALIALTIKLTILMISFKGKGQSNIFVSMVLVLALHNLCEVLGFVEFNNGGHDEYILRAFYALALWVASFMLLYSIDVSRISAKYVKAATIGTTAVLSALMLFSNAIITGSESIGYIMTVSAGSFYWLFQLFMLSIAILIGPFLVIGYRRATDHIVEIQCVYTLLAFLPMVVVTLCIMALMAMGVKVNAAVVFPIASTLFLLITLKSENEHKLSDVRRFIPNSVERQTANRILEICSSYSRDEISYRDGISEIEKMLVMQKYQKTGSNASTTAQLMGMPRSSLYSIFNRLKIDTKD